MAAKISHFEILFRVDAFVFSLAVPWHNNKTLRKDPHPTPAEFNTDVCNYLAANLSPFRTFLEPFLCLVGINRYYELDDNFYPTFLTDDDEGECSLLASFYFFSFVTVFDLFSFIHHADPTKVWVGEREVQEGEALLLELTKGLVVLLAGVNEQGNQNEVVQDVGDHVVNEGSGDAVVVDQAEQSDLVVQVRGIDVVADDEIQAIVADKPKGSRKKRKTTEGASGSNLPSKRLREDHGAPGAGANWCHSSGNDAICYLFRAPTPENEGGGPTDSISGPNFTNAAGAEVDSIVRSSAPPSHVITMAIATTAVAGTSSAPALEPART
ncbi:hypothetical protein Tco_1566683, partial [Tanacetum coccineum]